jgi:hypothetical protein
MNIDTARAKELDAYVATPDAEVKDFKVRTELKGQIKILPVYRFPIKQLFYNIRNGRFAAELIAKEEELKRKLDATSKQDALILRDLLLDQNENETIALREDLELHGQIDPGIITFDGAVINANRRMAILSSLFDKTSLPRFEYLMAARLPRTVDERDLWRIEAGLQFAKDFRLEYGPVNELLKLKEGLDRGLSERDISQSLLGRYTVAKIREKLDILKLIESYLDFVGKPREYHHIHDERSVQKFDSLQTSVIAPLRRKQIKERDIAKLITLAFSLIDKTDLTHWDIRMLSKIALDPKANKTLYEPLDKKPSKSWSKETLEDAFASAQEVIEDQKEQDRPERLLKRALSAIQSIKHTQKLKDTEARSLLLKLKEEISRLLTI